MPVLSRFIAQSLGDVFGSLWDGAWGKVKDSTLVMLDMAFGGINGVFADAFSNPIIRAILWLLSAACWVVFGASLIFYFLQIAREKQRDWANIVNYFIAALACVAMNQLICQLFFLLPGMLVAVLKFQTDDGNIFNLVSGGTPGALIQIVIFVSLVCFLFISLKRFGQMFVQALIAPFYVPAFLLGNSQLAAEWFKSTAACGFLYALQYISFYGGFLILYYSEFDFGGTIFGLSVILGTFSIPPALQRFTNISSGGRVMQTINAGSMAFQMGMQLLGAGTGGKS